MEDIIRDSGINRLDSVIIKPGKYSDYLTSLISCYLKIDSNNINARIATLYNMYLFLYNFFDLSDVPSYCCKSIDYIYEKTNLNLSLILRNYNTRE